jgi:fimbrial chaperone protein
MPLMRFQSPLHRLGQCRARSIAAVMAGALLLATLPAAGGQFSVTPVRIFMAPKDRATAITLTNEGDTELVMQADIYLWRQKPGGEEDLMLSEDMVLSPPIVKLAPKSRQVVRLAMLRPMPANVQHTYRLIVREIPEARPADTGLQLQIALAFSLPVFISPPGVQRKLECGIERGAAGIALVAACGNAGNAYAQPVEFTLGDGNGKTLAQRSSGGYILPGIQRRFELEPDTAARISAGRARLSVRLDDGSIQIFDSLLPE